MRAEGTGRRWRRGGLGVVLVLLVVAIAGVATYDAEPFLARHQQYTSDIGPLAAAAASRGQVNRADARRLDAETRSAIVRAHSRVRALLALRRFERAFAGGALDLGRKDGPAFQADLARLERDMAAGYANLDWMVEHRGMDLAKLHRDTKAAIDRAASSTGAVLALAEFVRAFHDPHLRLTESAARPAPAASGEAGAAVALERADGDEAVVASCEGAGYVASDHGFHGPLTHLPGWVALSGQAFPTGCVGDLGVVRIAQLGETSYLEQCRQVFQAGLSKTALKLKTRALLQRLLGDAVRALKERGARRLLVDVSGDGGGTEWVGDVIAVMTDKVLTRFNARRVAPTCDRTAIWTGEKVCPVLGAPERRVIHGAGVWTGPLLVLADHGTGSAAEDLVAWLQQSHLAKVIGERTAGAGCGYFNGPGRSRLRAVPLEVLMPNCARFLEDGTNEIDGIAPDIELPLHGVPLQEQAAALQVALQRSQAS